MIDARNCTGCGACATVCPARAITMSADENGGMYPLVDRTLCLCCDLCSRHCPPLRIKTGEMPAIGTATTFAVQCLDEAIRANSSSGGLFSMLAMVVLEKGGIVYGAAMSDDCYSVKHIAVENTEALSKLRGSKYVQSDLGNTFESALQNLREGRHVLVSGTPCQIAGFRELLGNKEYPTLLLVDFICHGVPLPTVWEKYVREQEEQQESRIHEALFRNKDYGWKTFSLKLRYQNGSSYAGRVTEDPYLRGFINNCYLRQSCYNCTIRHPYYASDITMADLWGVDQILTEFSDDRGTSLAVVHTSKGQSAFNEASESQRVMNIGNEAAFKHNPSYYKGVAENPLRDRMLREMKTKKVAAVVEKYYGKTLIAKIRRKLIKQLSKINRE